MRAAATHFTLLRHAPTQWNEKKRIQGQQNSPLSPRGENMATTWGQQLSELKFAHLLISDLGRVVETAERINQSLNLSIKTDVRLREQEWGVWTGLTIQEIKDRDKKLLQGQEKQGWNFRPPGGESRQEVLTRSMQALADAHLIWPGKNILVVCHEGVIKCLLYHLLGRRFLPEEPQVIESFSLHQLQQLNGELTLNQINLLSLNNPK